MEDMSPKTAREFPCGTRWSERRGTPLSMLEYLSTVDVRAQAGRDLESIPEL